MPLVKERERWRQSEYQKWDYITLSDYKSRTCGTKASYAWLWFLAIIAVAVYAADTFTAVNLLAFNRWSSQINPAIPISTSKWIFAACILFSWALCGFEWIRAIRVIRRGNVVDSYLDPLAVTLQSIRPDQNWSGWRRFLVFAELTKSKKGADYIALFTYFQFKGAVRILLAEGPRQAVNALTLYSVMQANLIPTGEHAADDGHSAFVQFFVNIQILAQEHTVQALILFSMLFTFIIWVVSMLSFIIACVLYVAFLSHYIPNSDGTLSRYCRRKIDSRLGRIADHMFKKALKQQDARRRQHQQKITEKAGGVDITVSERRPTFSPVPEKDHAVLGLNRPGLARAPTDPPPAPVYSFRPSRQERLAPQDFDQKTVDDFSIRPGFITRTGTQSTKYSQESYDSDDVLLSNVATMGTSMTSHDQPAFAKTHPLPNIGKVQRSYSFLAQLDVAETGTANVAVRPDRGLSIRTATGSSQQLQAAMGVARKPLPPLNVHVRFPADADMGAMPPPLKPKPTAVPGTFVPPAVQARDNEFYSPDQQLPARNFSLLHRHQTPEPTSTAYPAQSAASPAARTHRYQLAGLPSAYAPYETRIEMSTYTPSNPPSPRDQRTFVRDQLLRVGMSNLPNTPQPPRRNMTMPMKETERLAAPRRVGTEPVIARMQYQRDDVGQMAAGGGPSPPLPRMNGMIQIGVPILQQPSWPRRYEEGRIGGPISEDALQPPRRNMTMPTDAADRFAPPRRAGTEPMPPRTQQRNEGTGQFGWNQEHGDRGPTPVRDGTTHQEQYGYEQRTRYRYI